MWQNIESLLLKYQIIYKCEIILQTDENRLHFTVTCLINSVQSIRYNNFEASIFESTNVVY